VGASASLPSSVDEYIAAQAAVVQPRLRELRAAILDALPDATEVIAYGIPTYRYRNGMVSFGAAKRHAALYGAAMGPFADELRDYDTAKGTVRFPLTEPIPRELVQKLVLAKFNAT
jgi:uncharacterized protein YdhG (YjbR/CyaY superfamily)